MASLLIVTPPAILRAPRNGIAPVPVTGGTGFPVNTLATF